MISVIIPALNEQKSLPKVLNDLHKTLNSISIPYEIIVADNGSTDNTAIVARENKARVVHEKEKGYGAACLLALKSMNKNTKIILFLDGDYSDYPEDAKSILTPIINGNYEFVLGSRVLGNAAKGALMPVQKFGNALSTWLMKIVFGGYRYTDLGPFRAITINALDKVKMDDRNYGFTIQMQIRAIHRKLRIKEVPVRYRKRIGKSKVSGTIKGSFLAGSIILRTIYREYKLLRNNFFEPL